MRRGGALGSGAMLWVAGALLPLLLAHSEQPPMLLGQPLWSRDGVAAQYVLLRKQFELHATPTAPVAVDITAQPSWSSQGDAGNLPKLLGAYKLAINGVQIAAGPGRSRDGELGVDRIADVRPVRCAAVLSHSQSLPHTALRSRRRCGTGARRRHERGDYRRVPRRRQQHQRWAMDAGRGCSRHRVRHAHRCGLSLALCGCGSVWLAMPVSLAVSLMLTHRDHTRQRHGHSNGWELGCV